MRTALFLLILALAVGPAWASSGSTLAGTIRDSHGTAIPDAAVALCQADKVIQQATTDDAGAFHFEGIPAGTYQVKVEASGATPAEYKVIVRRGHPAKLNIVLKSAQPPAH